MTGKPLTVAAQAVIDYAQQQYGAKASEWLTTPHPKLDGATPMSVIRPFPGRVENLIYDETEGQPW